MAMNETKRRILEAATKLFFQHGFSAVTMDDIAQQVGMSKKTLYQSFSSKEELFGTIIETSLQTLLTALDEILDNPNISFSERFQQYTTLVAQGYARSNITYIRDIKRNAPVLWERFGLLQKQAIETRFSRLLSLGVESGELRKDIEPKLLAKMAFVLTETLLGDETLLELNMTPLDLFRAVVSVLLDGARVRK